MTNVISITMAKNGIDIIEPVLRHLATQVDFLIVSDNASTDGTRDLLTDLSRDLPLLILDDPDPAYYQSKKMTALAKVARNMGAEWVVPADQDEIWYSPFGTIKEVLDIGPQWLVATADLYDHVTSSTDDQEEINPIKRIGWRRNYKGALPKVACRWREDLVIEQGNHSAGYHGGPSRQNGLLVVRHYPYRSTEQFVQKVRDGVKAYAATTGLPESSGAHWKDYGRILDSMGEAGIEQIYHTWFHLDTPETLTGVIYDPAPVI